MADEQRGLYAKYIVTKADGSPTDPEAEYLVLRLDSGWAVVAACRAALTFSSWVRDQNPVLADDIVALLDRLDTARREERRRRRDTPDPVPPST